MNEPEARPKETVQCIFCAHTFLVEAIRRRVRVDCPQCRRSFTPRDCAMLRAEIALPSREAELAASIKERPDFVVCVVDKYHSMDEDGRQWVGGFETVEFAREYARRRTRDSLEEQRAGAENADDLRTRWAMFGEECFVAGDGYDGAQELANFIVHPATPAERDWISLTPDPDMRRILQGPASAASA